MAQIKGGGQEGRGAGLGPPREWKDGNQEGQNVETAKFLLKTPGRVRVNHRGGTRGMSRSMVHPKAGPGEGHPQMSIGQRPRRCRTGLELQTFDSYPHWFAA